MKREIRFETTKAFLQGVRTTARKADRGEPIRQSLVVSLPPEELSKIVTTAQNGAALPLGAICLICENQPFPVLTAAMSPIERIPLKMAEKYAAITALVDAFCAKQLNEEYRVLIHRVVANLARKRPSPLLNGKESVWAAAAVHAVGRVNFLDDPSRVPHCKPKILYEFFGVAQSTGQNKSKEIREALRMGSMSPEWTLPSRLADNPLVWMLQVNGLMIDIRQAPAELQRLAYEKGLIPFIPAERSGADA